MDQNYKHSLYFVADDLEDQAKKKIRRYFMKRRDSGGGNCGEIQKIGEKLHKITFEQQEDQERVLNRKSHTISLPSGQLNLNVARTETEARSLETTPNQSSPKPSKASNYLERTFSWDIYLLQYLHDCSKAFKILEKQVYCIGCTVELNFDQEIIVVKADAQKGLGGAFSGVPEKWEMQVDRVLSSFKESFICFNVVDPKKVKIILQDQSFADDDVKVYNELGYLVVVGEKSIVEEKIQSLNRNLPTKTELSVDERQYALIGEEFSREMRTNLPNVRIIKSNNVTVLEGLDHEVQLGLDLYENLLKNIKQKYIPFSPELQNFFTTSDAIAKYKTRFQLCLRNPVCLEMLNLDLVLSSLSMEAVDEATAILERDFSMTIVHLEGNAAVSPDLDRINELLTKSKDQANIQERRIDVNLVPAPNSTTKIQLVGYSECVNQLKEELHNYLLNHVTVQDTLDLPNTEMVELFGKVLTLFAPKDSRVSMNASLVPYPRVLLSGPQQIVRKTKLELHKELESLISDTLVIDGPGASQYYKAEGKPSKELIERSNQVIIQEMEKTEEVLYTELSTSSTSRAEGAARRSSDADTQTPFSNVSVEIKLGDLINEQVDVRVVPMVNKSLQSTKIGKSLVKKGGLQMKIKFSSSMKKSMTPGKVLEVIPPASVGCSKLFFIECLPWDGMGGQSIKALSSGLQRCLEMCEEQRHSSVALTVIGLGKVLKYPLREAILLLTEKLHQFGRKATAPCTVHIVIKPDEDDTEEICHEVHKQLIQNQGGQASFRSVSSELNDLSITVNGVQLELVFGDITNERTHAVVNSTNFESFNTGVCKDILAVAGPEVEAELQSARVHRGDVFVTQPGRFPCQGLLHLCGQGDIVLIRQLMGSIVQYCEAYEWSSVAVPAIGAGGCGFSAGVVAGAMLQGLSDALSIPLMSLVKIRLVLNKVNVFTAFKEEASQIFPGIQRVVPLSPFYPPPPPEPAPPPPASIAIPRSRTSSSDQKSVFKIIGLSQDNISKATAAMKEGYQAQNSSQTFKKQELDALTPADFATLKEKVESFGLNVQLSEGDWIVTGLTVKVNQVIDLVKSFMYGTLTREIRTREEEELYRKVAWCIQGSNGEWERLPKAANYELENKETDAGVADAHGLEWDVDFTNMELIRKSSTEKAALKRLENLPDFTFPLYWDNMTSDQNLRVVPLLPTCAEYLKVKLGFQQTCTKNVIKIERVQNVHLRKCYEAQLKHISEKNKQIGGANERLLYHGTTKGNAKSIMNTGFDWRFSGQNGTSYGQGNYFALCAKYSAHANYSKPSMDGIQRMFLARVLTGLHTLGQPNMRVPPPRDPQMPHDRFDSVVDNMNQPSMFIVFQDHRAYPDYLITFK